MNGGKRDLIRCAALALAVSSFIGSVSPALAQPGTEQPVDFAVSRTAVVSGLGVEVACRVLATTESITVLDAGEASSSVGVAPGRCTVTVYVLDVPVPVPILNLIPLGRLSFRIPGVAGFTFGLADVSIDLVTALSANYTGASSIVTPRPTDMVWLHWGANTVTISAHSGTEGNSLSVAVPYTFSMAFAIGVTVYALGLPAFSADLADVGTFAGTPAVVMPVTVDRRPSRIAGIEGWAPSAGAVQVNWTPNEDADFGSYRVRLEGGGSSYVYAVDTQGSTTLMMPATMDTDYTASVVVVDRAGQVSATSSVQVHTPSSSSTQSSPPMQNVALLVLGVLAAFAAGAGIAWTLRGRRKG